MFAIWAVIKLIKEEREGGLVFSLSCSLCTPFPAVYRLISNVKPWYSNVCMWKADFYKPNLNTQTYIRIHGKVGSGIESNFEILQRHVEKIKQIKMNDFVCEPKGELKWFMSLLSFLITYACRSKSIKQGCQKFKAWNWIYKTTIFWKLKLYKLPTLRPTTQTNNKLVQWDGAKPHG